MIGNNQIVEYINPAFPTKQMFKCSVGSEEYHSDNYVKVFTWSFDRLMNTQYYLNRNIVSDKACTTFMADVKIKD